VTFYQNSVGKSNKNSKEVDWGAKREGGNKMPDRCISDTGPAWLKGLPTIARQSRQKSAEQIKNITSERRL